MADWVSIALALTIVAGTFAAPHLLKSSNTQNESICLSQRVLGIDCPGCGMTRSVVALGRGDVVRAFEANWMAPTMFALALLHLVARMGKLIGLIPGLRILDLSTIATIVAIYLIRSIQIWL